MDRYYSATEFDVKIALVPAGIHGINLYCMNPVLLHYILLAKAEAGRQEWGEGAKREIGECVENGTCKLSLGIEKLFEISEESYIQEVQTERSGGG